MKRTKTLREIEKQLSRMRPKYSDYPSVAEWEQIGRFEIALKIAKRYIANMGAYLRKTNPYGRYGELMNTPIPVEIYASKGASIG